ncbi:MAG TPA: amino acid adenylation domain-containing protein [Acidimicrobiales bacterium]|nr:amino acid adenylation domain-containing protein [Acidimicrobiales bacterium]
MPDDATIPRLVEAQVDRGPAAVAVIDGEAHVHYDELDVRANRLAHHLRSLGVGPEVPVGICLPRSIDLAVGLLAILKAGGACLPLDPSYPRPRLAFMLDDAAAPVVLTSEEVGGRLPPHDARVVRVDADAPAIARKPDNRPAPAAGADNLAYLLYTSGSTGTPKGVMLAHRALVNHHRAAMTRYRLGPGDRVLQFCSISFDVSVEEIFPTWSSGATVVLRPDDAPILGRSWTEWLRRQRLSVVNLPTAYWHEWVRDLHGRGDRLPPDLRLVVVGGDKALGSVYRTWLEVGGAGVRWINAYGPTEASVMATVYEAAPGQAISGDPPIGRALPGVSVHLLDDRGRPVPAGETGEIHIGGIGLARGYLRRPELTAAAFIPDPFSAEAGARLYGTGDLARLTPKGDFEFVGRIDDQVKVRGFRIECGEVEAALAAHPAVGEAVVLAKEDDGGDKRLVAYTVASGTDATSPAELRRFLADRLPGYMVPANFVALEAFPLTPNGKLDRDALPPPSRSRPDLGASWEAPRGATEETVAAIWSQVLGVGGLGADDDFFELGGHSLLATQAVARLREAFAIELPLRAIFEAPTVSGLAAVVDEWAGAPDPAIDGGPVVPLVPLRRSPGGRIPLSLPQEQMWRLEAQASPRGLYNVTAQHRFAGPVDERALGRALDHLADRHEILRTSFSSESGRPWQSIQAEVHVELAVTDLGDIPLPDRDQELARRVGEEDARPFDLEAAPLFRAHLFLLGDGAEVAVTFDHLVSDGTSAYIFLSELADAYSGFAERREPNLRPLPVQYADFAVWQRRQLTDARLDAELSYWKRTLAGMPLGPAVPFDRVPTTLTRRIVCRPFTLDPETYRRLHHQVRRSRASMFVACVAALQAVAGRMGDTTDVVLSTTLSGRSRPELEGLIGFFAGVGRIRTDLAGDPTLEEVLARARDRVLGLFEHQNVPFLRVRDALLPDFPTQVTAVELMAVLPVEIQYFHAAHDEWAPGVAVVERPGPDKGPGRLYFRGQLPPLSLTFLDDGARLWAECNYKTDFYDEATIEALTGGVERALAALADTPDLRFSQLKA